MTPVQLGFVYAFLSFLTGVAGWFIAHAFAASRDSRTRQLAFIGFIHSWRSDIERTHHRKPDDVWAAYRAGVSEFHGLLSKVRGTFKGEEFAAATEALGSLRIQDIRGAVGDPRDVICTHLDTLKRVCK